MVPFRASVRSVGLVVLVLGLHAPGNVALGDDDVVARSPQQLLAQGRALFEREWTPGVPSTRGGDGLGPVYNDTSCVACHNLGGTGGGGPQSKNVHFLNSALTPVPDEKELMAEFQMRQRKFQVDMAKRRGMKLPPFRKKGDAVDREPLIRLHAGFRNAATVALPRYGPEADYESWRLYVLAPDSTVFIFGDRAVNLQQRAAQTLRPSIPHEYGHFTLSTSERNPPPLFGAGLIDAIPEGVLENAAATKRRDHLEVRGRVSRLPDGRVGRFGWKAQAATLDEFVLTACAEELGLEVPGHPQAENPRVPRGNGRGLDLTRSDCDALTAFVAALPAPVESAAANRAEREQVRLGKSVFERVGCAACHLPALGPVRGIYSDLLLHDMGGELGASGGYAFFNSSPEDESETLPGAMPNGPLAFNGAVDKPRVSARDRSREWRTPPLWGLRDSGPYLHDGRAETLEQAVAFHGGEAQFIARHYFSLPAEERRAVERFLKALAAPAVGDRGGSEPEVPDFAVPPPRVSRSGDGTGTTLTRQ